MSDVYTPTTLDEMAAELAADELYFNSLVPCYESDAETEVHSDITDSDFDPGSEYDFDPNEESDDDYLYVLPTPVVPAGQYVVDSDSSDDDEPIHFDGPLSVFRNC